MPPVFPAEKADSIAALAARIGLDPQTLVRTVDAYNAAVRDGSFDHTELDDCRTESLQPPKTHWARRLDTPPFYAYTLKPGITFTYLGVEVDQRARVMRSEEHTSELQSLMRISYAVFCLKNKKNTKHTNKQ